MSASSVTAELNGLSSSMVPPTLSNYNDASDAETQDTGKNFDLLAPVSRTKVRSPSSPLTPARASCRSERDQLCILNDRLAQYIETVRQLELENQKLAQQLNQSTSISNVDSQRVKDAYSAEISEANILLVEMGHENDTLKSGIEKIKLQCAELEKRKANLTSSFSESLCNRRRAEEDMHNLTSRIEITQCSVSDLKTEFETVHDENKRYKGEIEKFKLLHEREKVDAVSSQTALVEALDEINSMKLNFSQEIENSQTQNKTDMVLEEISKQLEFVYTNKLHDSLHQMRQELENTLSANRVEIGHIYDIKMKNLHDSAEQNYQLELDYKRQSQMLTLQLHDLQSAISGYDRRLCEAEQQAQQLSSKLESVKKEQWHHTKVRDESVLKLKNELAKILQNYEDLMGTKVQLTSEIDRFRKMIDVEEKRLCLSPLVEQNGTATKRIMKRAKRLIDPTTPSVPSYIYAFSNGSTCEISITEIDRHGAYVKLTNESKEDVSMSSWCLKCSTSGSEDLTYKFHNKLTMKAGKTCSIYSSESSVTHEFPEVLVMKNQKWPQYQEKFRVVLYNSDDVEQAWAELNRIEVFEPDQSGAVYQNGNGVHVEDRTKSSKCSVM